MSTINTLEWEVLNATADDWESLEGIFQLVSTPAPHTNGRRRALAEIADVVHGLCQKGLLAARRENGDPVRDFADVRYVWQAWFRMSEAGRAAWASHSATMSA